VMPWCWDRLETEGLAVTKDRDRKRVIRDEARRTGEPYARVRQRLVQSDRSAPPLADMWTQWSRELAAVEDPLELLRLATGYLAGLERVLDKAAVMAVRGGASRAEVRVEVRARPAWAGRAARAAEAMGVVEPPPFPQAAAEQWRRAIAEADARQVCVSGGELRDYLQALVARAVGWCVRTGVPREEIAAAHGNLRRRFWQPNLSALADIQIGLPPASV